MNEAVTAAGYDGLLRCDFASFARRSFRELYPQTSYSFGPHIEIISAKLAAVIDGTTRRLIINLPPRHLKSLLASVAFPAWCLGRNPSAEILCVSYAQELADKLSRDCRRIVASDWYRRGSSPPGWRRGTRRCPNSRRRRRAVASPPRWAAC